MAPTPLTFKDCSKAAKIHKETFYKGWEEADFKSFLENPFIFGLKVEEHHEMVGYVLWREILDEAEILTIAIDPAYQRQGKAALLLDSVSVLLSKKNVSRIFLEVAEDNIFAQILYTKHGYVCIDKRPKYYLREHGKYIAASVFIKKLGT